jgi:type IV pilus assembly protein PilC
MPVFKYSAVNNMGEVIQGRYTAGDKVEILRMIREKQYHPTMVKEVVEGIDIKSFGFLQRVKIKDIAVFCRQFHAMLNAGVPIIQCLEILKQQTENTKLKEVITEVCENVRKGNSFSESMKSHRNVFPEILINMVEAGEVSGTLDSVMNRMAVHFEKDNKIKNKIKGTMVYPIILSIVAVGVIIFLLTFVMPTFIGMFESSGVKLPAPTRLLLAISKGIRSYWYILLPVLVGIIYIVRRYIKTDKGSYAFDGFILKIPVIKTTLKKIATARFTRTLSTLMSSGIPLLQGMEVVARVVGNKVVATGILNAREELQKGAGLAGPIKKMGIFPPMVDSMIKIGEESGTLDDILEKTATFYDDEVEAELQKLVTLIEPLLIVVMGGAVGFIVISIALPMFDMLQTVK